MHCALHDAVSNDGLHMQCILDCLPVSVSTEPVYSDDQCANSYSNPYKLYINGHKGMENNFSTSYTAFSVTNTVFNLF